VLKDARVCHGWCVHAVACDGWCVQVCVVCVLMCVMAGGRNGKLTNFKVEMKGTRDRHEAL
jgi:hypothetical protein